MKHKAGDIATIRRDLTMGEAYGDYDVLGAMSKLRGKQVTISQVIGQTFYKIEDDGNMYCWTDEMFEKPTLASSEEENGLVNEVIHTDLLVENYKLKTALEVMKTTLKIHETIINANINKDSDMKFNSVEQMALYLNAMNKGLMDVIDFHMNRDMDEVKREMNRVLDGLNR